MSEREQLEAVKQLEMVKTIARVMFGAMWDGMSEEDMQDALEHPIVEIGRETGRTDDQIIALLVKFLEAGDKRGA